MTTDTAFALLLAVVLLGPLVALMERTHRRSSGLPGAFDPAAVSRDADVRRTIDELRARTAARSSRAADDIGGQSLDATREIASAYPWTPRPMTTSSQTCVR